MKVVMGLGNPGPEHDATRHNVGWWCMDEFVHRTKTQMNNKRKELIFGELKLNGKLVVLAYPQTFVNRSGAALRSVSYTHLTLPTKA